ncbi:hypothetical protein [Pseudochryseolinea flava]|uniref:Outer membrane protein beta-barrel domain-containing protein n=1 Tax=Pseudochryseolinea flava TaxID=2059302 RepID=A0A364XWL7_9BACT|nr:hypothetical protein [Pseudochryseolinea flava]RAV98127.1 hypothetical protein DQQ10_24975 [Pseudochryseolinea flava]
MKKALLMAFTLTVISASASFAQGRWSLGGELAFPQGNFNNGYGAGIGVSGRYEGVINKNLDWMVTLGYIHFFEKNNSNFSAYQVPLNGGLKYYVDSSFKGFWFGGELGLNVIGWRWNNPGPGDDVNDSETRLGLAPQIGYHISNVDFSLRYHIIDDASYLGFRVAYVF